MGFYFEGEARVLVDSGETSVPIRPRDVHWERYVLEELGMGTEMCRVVTLDGSKNAPPFVVA
ncbi:hypothetical protein KR96_17790 [Ralstonia solanacearum]|nr:hypothetical protein KR96_17790 [Ralstonia solanacearum]KFX81442.1 hypothetical protein KR99_23170 [Ralstonia solanacearum]